MTKRVLRLFPICVLLCLTSCAGRSDHWLSLLEQAEEMNRNDVPFTSDSLGLALVRHYDHWWHSPYLRLRAYYMLGSAYRDMGEAPAAIHYYNIATEQVDTAHADSATYATLFRVYGQMAMIYGRQDMPMEKRDALQHYRHFAWLAHDTLSYTIAYTHMADVCYQMDDTAGVFAYTDSAYMLCQKYGYGAMAAQAYPTAIYFSLIEGDYNKAKSYMNIFENQSGLFDSNGNIRSGREHYYYSKGLYYIGVGDVDSAEYYYRKLIPYGYLYEAYKGLLSVYTSRKETDSIEKYVELAEHALGQWMGNRQTSDIIRSSAMYRYERNQNMALANAHRATRFRLLSFVILVLSALLFSTVYIIFRRRSQKQEMKLRLLNGNLMNTMKEREQLLEEYEILKREHERTESSKDIMALIEQKKEKITQLDETIRIYQKELGAMTYSQRKKLLMGNDIVEYFIRKKTIVPKWKAPTFDKWMALSDVYSQYMPLVAAAMDRAELSRQEHLTTILTHLDFSPGDIAILLDTGNSRISAVKKNACKKLFNEDDSGILKKRLVDMESGDFVKYFSTH